ncbi:MAG: TonB-dependent receptor plug domain-containing protein, partial [Prevotella sp.]
MKRHYILWFSVLCALCIAMPATAQDDESADDEVVAKIPKKRVVKTPSYPTVEVRGICVDAVTKQPLAGIMIQALGNSNYTAMTEENGVFTIKVPTFATALYVHSPEYLDQHVGLGTKNAEIHIEMISDKFRPMYGKSTQIVASSVANVQNTTSQTVETDIENLIGADVRSINRSGGPGFGTAMFVRGLNSLTANAQPLIVIDGVVQDMQQTRSSLHYGDYNNLLLNINPEDIEKVTVLKNATALYGAKGGNGVILIETKRGHSMATRIDANIGVGVTLVPRTPEVMDAAQYRLYASEMLGTYPEISDFTDPETFKFLIDDPSKYYYAKFHNNTNWKDEVYQNALNQNYNINVQGGDDVGMYNLSLGYTDGQSTAQKNGFNRLNV